MPRYTYRGPSGTISAGEGKPVVEAGGEIVLTKEQAEQLRQKGHLLDDAGGADAPKEAKKD